MISRDYILITITLRQSNIAIEKWPIEIDGLPSYKIVIFHCKTVSLPEANHHMITINHHMITIN